MDKAEALARSAPWGRKQGAVPGQRQWTPLQGFSSLGLGGEAGGLQEARQRF